MIPFNPHIKYYEGDKRGYFRATVKPGHAARSPFCDQRADPNGTGYTERTFVVEDGAPGVSPQRNTTRPGRYGGLSGVTRPSHRRQIGPLDFTAGEPHEEWTLACVICLAASSDVRLVGNEPLVVSPVLVTAPLYNYEDAPATPDADDPAIWVNHDNPRRSLVIGTAKDAGLLVYDLSGKLWQSLLPSNAPQVPPEDPETPAG